MGNEDRVDLQSAFILHQRAYRDTSAIVDIFSRDFGRLSVLARGIKGTKNSKGALLQPFTSVSVSWLGKGELKTLTGLEQKEIPPKFSQQNLLAALYLNELLLRVLPKFDPCEAIFDNYTQALDLFQGEQALEPVLRRFERLLLESLGYDLNLVFDVDNGDLIDEHKRYHFLPDQGPVKPHIDNIGKQHTYSGKSLIAFSNDDYSDPETLETAKRITRLALKPLLGPKPLKSRELFISMKRNET